MLTTEQIKKLITENRLDKFYNSRSWRRKAKEIKAQQNNECQYCKAKGRVKPARIVHHVKHLKEFPELAYSDYYIDEKGNKQKQLVSCCYYCHEEQHEKELKLKEQFTNIEQW